MVRRHRIVRWALVVAGTLALAACMPTTTASPDNVMVNTTITLTGKGYPASTTITLEECGAASWVVPANPCLTAGAVTLTTSASGGFSTPFKMAICPLVGPPPVPVTERTCYVGEPTVNGVDTGQLTGAVKIIVTYP
jgi:hypothetical protein